jgi:hypothetical protein
MVFDELPSVELAFEGEVIEWRGPAPYHFVRIPDAECEDISGLASLVTYGWGVIPVRVQIGGSTWATSLFPLAGRYLLPLRDSVRAAEGIALGDTVAVQLRIELERRGRSES